MKIFAAYAANFELYPQEGDAFQHLSPLLAGLKRVEFTLRVVDPAANQGQIVSDFDKVLEQRLHALGAAPFSLKFPAEIRQALDFALTFSGRTLAVEIEKANREKILRDFLKCHMYLKLGADFALVALLKNYPFRNGYWNLFKFGMQRLRECQTYGFGSPATLDRILLLGFEQFDAKTREPLSPKTCLEMREDSSFGGGLD